MTDQQPSVISRRFVVVLLGVLLGWHAVLAASPAAGEAAPALEGVVRDQSGAPVAEAVVYLPEAAATPAPAAARRAVMDQVNRAFVPLALVVRVGTTVRFPNSESIHHSVYSFSRAKKFEIGLFQGQGGAVTLDRPGEVKVFCNIHKTMGGLIVVVDHPYAAVTDAQGRFRLRDVPLGTHVVRAVHAFALGVAVPVTVGQEAAGVNFVLKVHAPPSEGGGYSY